MSNHCLQHPRKHRGIHFPVASATDRAGLPQAYHVVRLSIAASAEETLSVEPRMGAASLFLGQRSAYFWGSGQLILWAAVSLLFGIGQLFFGPRSVSNFYEKMYFLYTTSAKIHSTIQNKCTRDSYGFSQVNNSSREYFTARPQTPHPQGPSPHA